MAWETKDLETGMGTAPFTRGERDIWKPLSGSSLSRARGEAQRHQREGE